MFNNMNTFCIHERDPGTLTNFAIMAQATTLKTIFSKTKKDARGRGG